MHTRSKMLSWGNYKRDEIRDEKLGRKRNGWGSRYSVPAEETAWQIWRPEEGMGREKGIEMRFLGRHPTGYYSKKSRFYHSNNGNHPRGLSKGPREAGDFFRSARMGILWKSTTGNLVHLIFVCFQNEETDNQEVWSILEHKPRILPLDVFSLCLTSHLPWIPYQPYWPNLIMRAESTFPWTPLWSDRSLLMFYIYQMLSLKSSKYSAHRRKGRSTEDWCEHGIPKQSHSTDQLYKGRGQTLMSSYPPSHSPLWLPSGTWLSTVMGLTSQETQSVPKTAALTVIQETTHLVPAVASNCGILNKTWPLTGLRRQAVSSKVWQFHCHSEFHAILGFRIKTWPRKEALAGA